MTVLSILILKGILASSFYIAILGGSLCRKPFLYL